MKLIWDIFHIIAILIYFFCIPIGVAFDVVEVDGNLFFLIFFFFESLITLNTAYYQKGYLI